MKLKTADIFVDFTETFNQHGWPMPATENRKGVQCISISRARALPNLPKGMYFVIYTYKDEDGLTVVSGKSRAYGDGSIRYRYGGERSNDPTVINANLAKLMTDGQKWVRRKVMEAAREGHLPVAA